MNIIVFSKDRAMQLDLFIRSFNKYVKNHNDYNIKVLYKFSNDSFKKGYDKINYLYNNVTFFEEKHFKNDLINLINFDDGYIVFFVDDNIFKNEIDFCDEQMVIFNEDSDILCRSLRLHPNLTYCYAMQQEISKHPIFLSNNTFYWQNEQFDYSYPMSLDGHIFRTKEILPYLIGLNYKNPNSLEGSLAQNPINLPKIICYEKSIIFNNPCNIVQDNNENKHGNIDHFKLNEKYLNDYIIDLNIFDKIDNNSCHQEIEFQFMKNNYEK